MKKIRVLVDGVGGDVGQGILKALKQSSLDIELFAACISPSSSWLYKINNSYIFPRVDSEEFIDFLIHFINKHQIDIYFPTVDSTLLKISHYKEKLENDTKVQVFIDKEEKIKICDDKYLTNQFLKNNNFLAPKTICLDDNRLEKFLEQNSFPLILKTKSGNGAKNIIKVNTYEEIKPFIGNSMWVLQELLDIKYEITSGIYLGDDHEIKGVYTLQRTLRCGSTHQAQTVIDEELRLKLIEIAKKMQMKYLNIQAVYKDQELLPFEFNGRLSGTTGAIRSLFNVPEMFIKERLLKEPLSTYKNDKKIFFTRYNEEVIYTEDQMQALIERSKNG